jgi:LacI family transcriptional regulator
VAAFDGTKESEFCWPSLTVARQPLPRLAAAAIGLLAEPESARGVHRQFQADLVLRRSCGCAAVGIEPTPSPAN